MRILMVGALSWNPERIRSLHERGHELWGCWARSMAWDQGPYPALEDCVRTIRIEDAARTIAGEEIECVYALFQVYDPSLWGPPAPGIEHDVWELLRVLFDRRAAGAFDAPIVFHSGFDVHHIDGGVARALDGQIFCNREQLHYWSAPLAVGGYGLDYFDACAVTGFLDGDRPKHEFMNDDVSERLSAHTGEIHTVCVGRPFNIDYVALARNRIHLHVYGNGVNDSASIIARDLITARATRELSRIREFVHLHHSLQPTGKSWPEVKVWKSRWVREFSRYDAGWSYIGTPYSWSLLEDRSAIPNRLSTYLLAGLPVVTDRRPGLYRYDELARVGVNIDLEGSDYEGLRARLDAEVAHPERRTIALAARHGYSFDAAVEPLIELLTRSRDCYFARPAQDRRRPIAEPDAARTEATNAQGTIVASRSRNAAVATLRRRAGRVRAAVSRRLADDQVRRVARRLRAGAPAIEPVDHGP